MIWKSGNWVLVKNATDSEFSYNLFRKLKKKKQRSTFYGLEIEKLIFGYENKITSFHNGGKSIKICTFE